MDHPIIVSQLLLPDPLLGPYVEEAPHAPDLQTRVNAAIATAAGTAFPAAIHNWDVSGGGGGATWRAHFDVANSPGWGLNTSIPVRLAQFACTTAQHKDQIRAETLRLLNALPATAAVWGIKYAGSSRDGTYLIAIMYSTDADGSGKPTIQADSYAPQGPYVAETTIIGLAIPQAVGGLAVNQREYFLHYSILLNDTTGSAGVIGRLTLDNVPVIEEQVTAVATDWICFSGVLHAIQPTAAAHQYALKVDVVGANVSCRGASMCAHLVNSESNEM